MQAHFVTFLSPGTFFSEKRELPIESWDVDAAIRMSESIIERHGARPYGFYFTTRGRNDDELDSSQKPKSGIYYLGGRVRTVEDVRRDAKPEEEILLANMERNGYARVVENSNSYTWTAPLKEDDVVLDYTPPSREHERAQGEAKP